MGLSPPTGSRRGAARLVQMTQNEKQRYPHSIVVSGGDNFSGSYFSKITKGEPIKEDVRGDGRGNVRIGNHEFDWGLPYLVDTAALNIPPCGRQYHRREEIYSPQLVESLPYRRA